MGQKPQTPIGNVSLAGMRPIAALDTLRILELGLVRFLLKTVSKPLEGSSAFIGAIKVYEGIWNDTQARFVGVLAHELQEVSPTSVVGKKDAVNEDGTPDYQAVDYGSPEIMSNIILELQTLRAELNAVKAELATLKGN